MPQPLRVEQKLIEAGRMPDAYRYDKTPLDAQVVEAVETDEWRREKITFIGRTKHWGQLRAFEVKTGADGHSGTTVD